MAVAEKICQQCGSKVPTAMLRCRECGYRFETVGGSSAVRSSGVFQAHAEKREQIPQQQALSLEDMLAFAEDAEAKASGVFNISRALPASEQAKPSPPVPSVARSAITKAGSSSTGPLQPKQPPVAPAPPRPESRTSSQSSVVASAVLESPSGVRKGRERVRKEAAGGSQPLQLAIRKALKQTPQAEESLLLESEQPTSAELKKLQKAWAKTVKKCRKALQENFDEHGRAAINAFCETLEDLSYVKTDEAVEILASYLSDARPAVRETAARCLGETRRVTAFEPLLKQLTHESSEMRAACVQGLGTLGDRRAIGPLITLASEDPQFNLRATDALVKLGEPAVPLLINVAEEAEPGQMLIAVMALGRMGDVRALEVLATRTTHPMHTVRSHAIEAIGILGESKGIRYLVRGLSDSHVGVKIQAAIGLRKLGDKRACDALIQALHDSDDDVREQAASALATCGDKSAAPALIGLLNSEQTSLCIVAAESLGKLGDEQAVPQLCAMLQRHAGSDHKPVRLKILDALRRLKNPESVPYLIEQLQDPAPEIRERAVDALGHIGDASVVVEIETLLKEDKSEAVRSTCAKALGEIGDAESAQALEEALVDTVQVRIKAVIALGQIGNPGSLLVLTALLRDQLPELRYHASLALAEIGDQRSIRPVEVLAADADPMVSRGALKALQKLGDERSEKEILKAARKRSKKTISIKSKSSSLKDLFNPAVLRDMVWPDDPKKRMLVMGIAGGAVSLSLLVVAVMFSFSEKKVVLRGYPISASFSPDGTKIANGRTHGAIEIWSLKGRRPDAVVHNTTGGINTLSFISPKNFWFTSGPRIVRYDGSKLIPVAEQKETFIQLFESFDHKRVAFLDRAGSLYVYDTQSAQPIGSLAFPGVKVLNFSPAGDQIAAVVGNEVKVFDLKGAEQATLACESPVTGVCLSPDNSQVAVSHGKKSKFTIFNLANKAVVHELTPEKPLTFNRMLFHSEGKELILLAALTAGEWKGLATWKLDQTTFEFNSKIPPGTPADFNSSANLICWLEDETAPVFVFDVASGGASRLNYNPL